MLVVGPRHAVLRQVDGVGTRYSYFSCVTCGGTGCLPSGKSCVVVGPRHAVLRQVDGVGTRYWYFLCVTRGGTGCLLSGK